MRSDSVRTLGFDDDDDDDDDGWWYVIWGVCNQPQVVVVVVVVVAVVVVVVVVVVVCCCCCCCCCCCWWWWYMSYFWCFKNPAWKPPDMYENPSYSRGDISHIPVVWFPDFWTIKPVPEGFLSKHHKGRKDTKKLGMLPKKKNNLGRPQDLGDFKFLAQLRAQKTIPWRAPADSWGRIGVYSRSPKTTSSPLNGC